MQPPADLQVGALVCRRDGTPGVGWLMFFTVAARGHLAWVYWRGRGARPEAVDDLRAAGGQTESAGTVPAAAPAPAPSR
jgi:hypothetical protein